MFVCSGIDDQSVCHKLLFLLPPIVVYCDIVIRSDLNKKSRIQANLEPRLIVEHIHGPIVLCLDDRIRTVLICHVDLSKV
jgi:hypothetical protein